MTEDWDWREQALCSNVSPEIFFPNHGDAREAKRICACCPVKQPCLEYALERDARDPHCNAGIYGGLSPAERAEIRKNAS